MAQEQITVCPDPKDDKFLSLAVSAKASAIVSGDDDLLVLHPFDKDPRSYSLFKVDEEETKKFKEFIDGVKPEDFFKHFNKD